MTPEEFVGIYERALATQQWASVELLIHENACVTFSNGTVHKGKAAVRTAFEQNFSAITDETYRISNVYWILRTQDVGVYLFDFKWTGRIGGRDAAGGGRGTSVVVRDGDDWKLLAEHLGPASP
jgi:ketosteroid isomerase-like protein